MGDLIYLNPDTVRLSEADGTAKAGPTDEAIVIDRAEFKARVQRLIEAINRINAIIGGMR